MPIALPKQANYLVTNISRYIQKQTQTQTHRHTQTDTQNIEFYCSRPTKFVYHGFRFVGGICALERSFMTLPFSAS